MGSCCKAVQEEEIPEDDVEDKVVGADTVDMEMLDRKFQENEDKINNKLEKKEEEEWINPYLEKKVRELIRELRSMNESVGKIISDEHIIENSQEVEGKWITPNSPEKNPVDDEKVKDQFHDNMEQDMTEQEIEVLGKQIQSLKDKLVELENKTSIMQERIKEANRMDELTAQAEKELGSSVDIVYGQDGVDPKIIHKLRASLRKIAELEMKQKNIQYQHNSEVEHLKMKMQHHVNEKTKTQKQLTDIVAANRLKRDARKELQDLQKVKTDDYEQQISKLEASRQQVKLELKDARNQCEQLSEEKGRLEIELKSLQTQAETLAVDMGDKFQDLAVDIAKNEARDKLQKEKEKELVEKANKLKRLAEKEKAVAEVNKEMYVKLRTVNTSYKIKFREVSANMKDLVKQLQSFNVGLANVVQGWLSQLTTVVTKRIEPVWFKEDLLFEDFINWTQILDVFISREHLAIVFDIVADPLTKRISAERLKSMLSSDLEINSAFKILLKNSGRVKYEDEEKSSISTFGENITELLESSQGNIFMQLTLLLNEHKHHKRMRALTTRYISDMGIMSVASHFSLEVNSLVRIIQGGQPYGTKDTLSEEEYLVEIEKLSKGLAKNIMDGKTEIKQDVFNSYQSSSNSFLGQLKAIEEVVVDLMDNLKPGRKKIAAQIIKHLEGQLKWLEDNASILIPGLNVIGMGVVERMSKMKELIGRLEFLNGQISVNGGRNNGDIGTPQPGSGYTLSKQDHGELIYQLGAAKRAFAQFKTADDMNDQFNPSSPTIERVHKDSPVKTRFVNLEGKESQDSEGDSRVHSLRKHMKMSASNQQTDTSFKFLGGSSALNSVSKVNLLGIKRNIERAFEILIALKNISSSVEPSSPVKNTKKAAADIKMEKRVSNQTLAIKNLLAGPEKQFKGMSVAIIGGSWVGCHIAIILAKRGVHVHIYEPKGVLKMSIEGAKSWVPKLVEGSYASFRIPSGARYPSNPETRYQCIEGRKKFLEIYGNFVEKVECLYAIGEADCDGHSSKTRPKSYARVIRQIDSKSIKENPAEHGIEGVLGIWRTYESLIHIDKPGTHFLSEFQALANVSLRGSVEDLSHNAGYPLLNGEKFDWVLNCTNFEQHTYGILSKYITYQPYIKLLYTSKKIRSSQFHLTILDGNFISFELLLSSSTSNLQFFDGIHFLGSVKEMPLYALTHFKHSQCGGELFSSLDTVQAHLRQYNQHRVKEELRPIFEHDMARFYPNFTDEFEYVGYASTVVTKFASRDVFKGCVLRPTGSKILHVFVPRINEIFHAEQSVLKLLVERSPADSSKSEISLENVRDYFVQPFGFSSTISQTEFERVFLGQNMRRRKKRDGEGVKL